jgi:sialate O-acetylesterase
MHNLHRAAAILLFALPAAVRGDVKPCPLFGDHMVLQQGMQVPVWGTASPGEQVTVTLGGQSARTVAGPDGRWIAKLPVQKAGDTPVEMTISGNNSITLKDVLIGEVWIGSGQSNMAFTVSKAKASYAGLVNEAEEIAAANYPKVRMFTVKTAKTYEPQTTLAGEWQVCTPENVPGWSAVGYLFARDLHRELQQPVGIVTTAFGASTAESWISREAIAADPQMKPMLDGFDASVKFFRENPTATADKAPPIPRTINSRPSRPGGRQRDPVQDQHQPTVLFNGMLNPVIPYAMRGVVWYQGESIVGGDAGLSLYPHVQAALITDWRKRWGEGDFPFYIVQLPALQNLSNNPRVREGQAQVLSLPNTGMAVTIDIGDPKDVHPHNKAPLGERLTKIALANAYGRKIEYSGPQYASMKVQEGTVRLAFTHLAGGLVAKGGPLKWFQIAGADQKFVDAQATIDGDAILVSSPDVKEPIAVRYAWDNYPDGCNLYNAAGLPASPFRSDHWQYPIPGIVE